VLPLSSLDRPLPSVDRASGVLARLAYMLVLIQSSPILFFFFFFQPKNIRKRTRLYNIARDFVPIFLVS
jgi:hypothetical protein